MINIHIQQTSFNNESRIIKEVNSLLKCESVKKIIIYAFSEKGLPNSETVNEKTEVKRVKTIVKFKPNEMTILSKLMLMLEWNLRVYFLTRKIEVSIINCHSVETLPLGVFLKKRKKAKLIYDAHELETEKDIGGFLKKMYKVVEKKLIKRVDALITVSNGIDVWYKKEYGNLNSYVVKNVPVSLTVEAKNDNYFHEKYGVDKNCVMFIFQGAMTEGRNIEILLNVFSEIGLEKHIVFMGNGILEETIKTHAKKYANIHWHPMVPSEKVLTYTCNADCGISIIENTSLSFYYSLPNKLFEYIMSGIPVLASDFPDIALFINENKLGWLTPSQEDSIKNTLASINKETISEKKRNVHNASAIIGWHNEEKEFFKAYSSIL